MKNLIYQPLNLVTVTCCVCETNNASLAGNGKDFEYNPDSETFSAMQCNTCGLVYLNPRPDVTEFEKIYPENYHAFDFSEKEFGIVHKIRSWLEGKRLLVFCEEVPVNGRILDVGCGDGFHLNLLRKYGDKSWSLEGIDMDKRAVEMAEKSGLKVHRGTLETVSLPENLYDLAFTIQTIEHVEKPDDFLKGIYKLLKPGGRLVIVTDNTGSLDFKLFKKHFWGGYHFPRHWNLFNKKSLAKLAAKTGFEVAVLATQVSPVNWVYTIHNWLVHKKAPQWLINQFTLKSTVSLSFFTVADMVLQKLKKGALLRAFLRKPV
jgi:2-polyprenyl-3-methyl-5-hydroxy-6-metoxy-1,4-benzoquinol methylase